VTVVGLVATVGMNFTVLIPPLAANVLGSDAAGYGFLMTASGLGALGAAIALIIGGRPHPVRIAGGAIVLGIASVALSLSTSFPLSLALMIPIGAGGITMAATANATIQLAVPDGLRGRVMSVYTTVFSASIPIGGLAVGAVASVAGIPTTVAIGGLLSLAVGLGAYVWWRKIGSPSPSLGMASSAAVTMITESATAQPGAATAQPGATPAAPAAAVPQSTAPKTRAAFSPPNPNEVLSTRR
jgi:MFS family permease